MNFKHFIENPVKVAMLFLALVLLGGLSYRKLPLNLFPDLQTPRITLVVETEGLTPEETERRLTTDFERQLASIKGVSDITSFSREDSIVIHIDFHWDQDMEFAYLDVKKSVGALENNEYVTNIDVHRFDPNAAALMTLAFLPGAEVDAPEVDRVRITSLVENSLKPRLETVQGVAYVKSNGVSRREVTVLLDEDVMAPLNLTPAMVMAAIRSYGNSSSGGTIIEGNEQVALKFISRFRTVDDIGQCVVTMIDDHPIHLEDLGELLIDVSEDEVSVRQDGIETVSLDIFREPDANAVLTARRVREVVRTLNERGGFGLKIAVDRSLEVEAAINEVVRSALIGMGLAMVILWLFLRNLFATIVVAAAIPISIIATFSLMYFQGLSLNIMTLGGLALGAGMLVDNGIVVIENIFRHRTRGDGVSPVDAAVTGARQVALAITAATLTTIVVFVPLIYVHGIAGILFKDQALTVVYSLLTSLLVALLLIPMLASRIAPGKASKPGLINRAYGGFLSVSLRARWLLLLLFFGIMWVTWEKAQDIPTRFFPESVNGQLSLLIEMPPGTPLERTRDAAARLETPLLDLRYRDPDMAPLLRSYAEWSASGDIRRFLLAASRDLAEIDHAKYLKELAERGETPPEDFPSTVTLSASPLVAQIQEALFPPGLSGKLERLVNPPESENVTVLGREFRFLSGDFLTDLTPWTRSDVETYRRRVADFLDPFVIIRSITTTVGIESGSVRAAGEKILGPHTARMEIVLNPNILREISAEDIISLLRDKAATIPELNCSFESRNQFLQQILGKDRGDVVVEVHAEKLEDLRDSAAAAAATLGKVSGLANVRTSLVLGEEAFVLEPDSDALLRGDFQISDLVEQIQAYIQGEESDEVKLLQGEMRILVKSPRAEREGLEGLLDLEVISSRQKREKLRNLVFFKRERGIRDIMRVNQERTILVMADLDGVSYTEAITSARRELDAMEWGRGGSFWNLSGEEVKRRESFEKLLFALLIAIVLVYMVIASILESIIHPLTIMLSVPLAFAGVVAAFLYAGVSLNLMGFIGVVMLTGIVVNNAIVLLDRIHQIREPAPHDRKLTREAVVLAGRQRLRPIVMTSLTTLLALVPLAMGFGNGAELRRPMAVAVIGGLASSTLLTLWILPGLYLCVEDALAVIRYPFALLRRLRKPKEEPETET